MSSSEAIDQGPRRLAAWLVGAHLVVGLVLGGLTRWFRNESEPHLVLAVFAGVAFAQAGLTGIWLALSSLSLLLRLMVTAAGVGYLAVQFAICVEAAEATVIYVMMFGMAVAPVGLPLWALRCYGIEVVHDQCFGDDRATRQFSIRQLMTLTFVVACAVTLTRWIEVPLPFVLRDVFPTILSLIAPFAVVVIAALWVFLGARRLWMGLVALPGIAIGAAYALRCFVPSETMLFWTTATLTEALTLAVTLGLLRYRGYGLRRQRRRSSS